MTVTTSSNGPTEGIFGPRHRIPSLSDLIPIELMEAFLRGFGSRHPNVFNGIIQNDGTVFPTDVYARESLYCPFCTLVRSTPAGKAACRESDLHGLELLKARFIQSGGKPEVVKYYCHAGNLEILAPIVLETDAGQLGVIIGGFWAGQALVRNNVFSNAEIEKVSRRVLVDANILKQSHAKKRAELDEEELGSISASLLQWANALSETASKAFRLKESVVASELLDGFGTAVVRGMERATVPKKGRAREEILAGFLKPALKKIQTAIGLRAINIWKIPRRSNVAEHWVGSHGSEKTAISIEDVDTIRPDQLVLTPATLCHQCHPQEFKTFFSAMFRNRTRVDLEAAAAFVVSTARAGHIVIICEEDPNERWLIHRDCLQPSLKLLMQGILTRAGAELDTLAILESERAKNDELLANQKRIEKLVIRMAHLVSRPLLELELAASLFIKNPNVAKNHIGACLTELRRAVRVFQTFEFISQQQQGATKASGSAFTHTSLPAIVQQAIKNLEPLSRLRRVEVEACLPREGELSQYLTDMSSDWLLEVLENVLHNALKYSLGGKPVEITFLNRKSEYIAVFVTNYGCGIPEEDFGKVFELEYRSTRSREFDVEGSGIGLWVVRSLLSLCGGSISVWQSEKVDEVDYRDRRVSRFKTVFRIVLLPSKGTVT